MHREGTTDRYLLPVLIAGFALLFLLLLGSGVVAIGSMRFMETDATRFVAEQQSTAKLIYEVQSEEGNLSSVFYSLATKRDHIDRGLFLARLDALESAIHRTTRSGRESGDAPLWDKVRSAADSFVAEGRNIIRSGRPPTDEFYQRHQNLLASLADLTSSNYAAGALKAEAERLSSRVRYSLVMLETALGIAIVGALLTVYLVNRIFHKLRWQTAELAHLSSRTMSDQEETARRLSREMHDHFGQTLSAIEANLVSMQRASTFHPGRLEDCLGLVKDAVENVREVSHLLRPSILDDFGMNASLRWLADRFSERTGKIVRYESTFHGRLEGGTETQLFRIAQEALTNVARHSEATEVRLDLHAMGEQLRLSISDNGKGIDPDTVHRGTGMVGMRARTRAAGGRLSLDTGPGRGVSITVEIPLKHADYAPQDQNSVSR